MWTPTHVKVTVQRAKNLKIKGRSGSNDSYVIIYLDDDKKFTTSVKTRSKIPEWNESFDMQDTILIRASGGSKNSWSVPSDLRGSVLRLSVYHRNLFGFDDLLGEATILLGRIRIYEKPQSRWYCLSTNHVSKKDEEEDEEGNLQVTVSFMVQSRMTPHSASSEGNFQRQRSLSFRSLVNLVGIKLVHSQRSSQVEPRKSPLSELTERRLPLHSLVEINNVSRCFHRIKLSSSSDDDVFQGNQEKQTTRMNFPKTDDNDDDDNEEEEEEERKVVFHINPGDSECSLRENINNDNNGFGDQSTPVAGPELVRTRSRSLRVRPRSLHSLVEESNDWRSKETVDSANDLGLVNTPQKNSCSVGTYLCPDTPSTTSVDQRQTQRHSCIGSCGERLPMVPTFQLRQITRLQLNDGPKETNDFDDYDRDGLIGLIREQQSWMKSKTQYVHDLEKYIDELLVRVLETNQQTILENPYNQQNKKAKSEKKSQKKSSGKMKTKQFIDLLKNGRISEIFS